MQSQVKIIELRLQKLKRAIEWGWTGRVAEKMDLHKNQISQSMAGHVEWSFHDLNRVCRAINEIGLEEYGDGWDDVGVDDFIQFREIATEDVEMGRRTEKA